MRAELPWNVAGIAPEAREAARAAARREGLSVGEWLTRRILRELSGIEDEVSALSHQARTGMSLDSWGLPQSDASLPDSEEMLARVGRSESESSDAWNRIEEQLRGLSRRLESSERSHGESNRLLSRTTQEMNITAREQTRAFGQLGQDIVVLNTRLERLERNAANTSIREAIKALHQGLSRLADQITATTSHSAAQVAQVTANLEKLAGQVSRIREDADTTGQRLEQRIGLTEKGLSERLEEAERAWEQRFSVIEKTAEANTSALEKVETASNDRQEQQHKAAQQDETIQRLIVSFGGLERRLPAPDLAEKLEERLDQIEHSVGGLSEQLYRQDQAAKDAENLEAPLQALSHRLEKLEQDHAELLAEMRDRLTPPEPTPEPMPEPAPQLSADLHPPLAMEAAHQQDGASFEDAHDLHEETLPDFSEVFVEPEPENFFSAARHSARAASEEAESEQLDRVAGFRWSGEAAQKEEKAKPRFVIPLVVALIVVMVVAAALLLSRRAPERVAMPVPKPAAINHPAPPPAKVSAPSEAPSADDITAQSSESAIPTLPALPGPGADLKTHQNVGPDANLARPESTPPKTAPEAATVKSPDLAPAIKPLAGSNQTSAIKTAPVAKTAPVDRVTQQANAGNPTALAILGLRALDGAKGQSVNLPSAVKLLTQAAEKGQAVAQYRLGTLFERGQGVAADPVKAMHWYELAANQGNRKAMHNLAVAYASGSKKDMAEAARWFARAAALGLADSQFNLAVLYERGDGVPQSLADAYKWYSVAAAGGDAESKARMGVLQTQLNVADQAGASRSAMSFRASPLNRSTNVPPEAADLGN